MKFRTLLVLATLLITALAGCASTPSQQYRIDAALYNGASIGLGIAHKEGKIKEPTWVKITGVMSEAKSHLIDAYAWLQANPNLANVPGYTLPALDPAGVAIGILLSYVNDFELVPLVPPSPPVPATQPATQAG